MLNRRNFLKQTSFLGAVALLPAGLSATEGLQSGSPKKKPEPPVKQVDIYTVNMKQICSVRIPPRQISIPDVEGFKALKLNAFRRTGKRNSAIVNCI